jgi:formylglycine-generating enzyme required for sulfatase activity
MQSGVRSEGRGGTRSRFANAQQWLCAQTLWQALWLALVMSALLTAGSAQAQQPQTARRLAVLIGNANYASEKPLVNPHADAALLARTFRQDLQFTEVIERRDLTRKQLFDLLEELRIKAYKADAVVVYFSGHGMRGPGGNYLIPVDAQIQAEAHVRRDALAASEVVDVLKASEARVALLVLDACRNSPFSERTKSGTKGLGRMQVSGGNLLVAYAAADGQTADDGAPGNSPYARALAEQLRQRDRPVLVQLDAVRRSVIQSTAARQNPTREGDLETDVRLVPGPGTSVSSGGGAAAQPPAGRDSLENEAWALCRDARTAVPCEAYLKDWSQGRYAKLAQTKLEDLRTAAAAPPVAANPAPSPAPGPAQGASAGTGPSTGHGTGTGSATPPSQWPGSSQTFTVNGVSFQMQTIPAGSFMMGSPENEVGRLPNEGPQRRVSIKVFQLGQTEVTQALWDAVMWGRNPSSFNNCGPACPVESVSWNDAQTFIDRLNSLTGQQFRLPSEAEWEYAARAGCETAFSVGGQCRSRIEASEANFNGGMTYNGSSMGENRKKTVRVGSFAPNAFGLHDMHGNVCEWVQDIWHQNYDGAPSDGSVWSAGGVPALRVLRGGSWIYGPQDLRSANRNRFTPVIRIDNAGFRIARTP